MTTAEVIVCNVLNCGIDDIECMFSTIAENGLLIDAVQECKDIGNDIDANGILYSAFEIAIRRCFAGCCDNIYDMFEIRTNCRDSCVEFIGNKEDVEGFDSRAEDFAELTGFDIQEVQ